MIVEAVFLKANEEERKARKQHEVEEWKKRGPEEIRRQIGS